MSTLAGGPYEGREFTRLTTPELEAAVTWAKRALAQADREHNDGLRAQHTNDLTQLDAERQRRFNQFLSLSEQPQADQARKLGAVVAGSPPPATGASIRSLAPLKALTVWQPWAWAIAEGFKRVENRDWKPYPKVLAPGERIAIHAAVRALDREALKSVRHALYQSRGRADGPLPWEVPVEEAAYSFGCIVAVAKFSHLVTLRRDLPVDQQPWFVGQYGWVLDDVRKLAKPVQVRGAQGIWQVPGAELFAIDEQLKGKP